MQDKAEWPPTETAPTPAIASGDVRGGPDHLDWYVGCWFTPSYAHWTGPLKASLDAVGAPYHMLACAPRGGSWEAETMQKPSAVLDLMDAHPGKTLVLLDVDCQVRRSPQELVDTIRGDVAAYLWSKRNGRAKDRARVKIMSGTMVLRPTPAARTFVERWRETGRECEALDVDQTSLMITLARSPDVTFQPLDEAWCDFEGRHPAPAIVHDNASARVRATGWQRGLARMPLPLRTLLGGRRTP